MPSFRPLSPESKIRAVRMGEYTTSFCAPEDSEIHRAATALTCGDLEVISRVQGPQTSYRAELQGARLFVELAEDGDTLTLDNKAVVDYGPIRPHREASDMDYRLPLADKLQQKRASLRWIPGHREEAQATSPADKQDIQ